MATWGAQGFATVEFFKGDADVKTPSNEIVLLPDDVSFSITDSIYSLYNTASFDLEDGTGIMAKLMLHVHGFPLTINFTLSKDSPQNLCQYVVNNNGIKFRAASASKLSFDLVNKAYHDQTRTSAAYSGMLATAADATGEVGIINEIAAKYPSFAAFDIDASEIKGTWYQPLITDASFIMDVLLPNAYSPAAKGSPFFCWTTSDGVFHFRHLKSLFDQQDAIKNIYILDGSKKGMGGLSNNTNSDQMKDDPYFKLPIQTIFKMEKIPNDWMNFWGDMNSDNYVYRWDNVPEDSTNMNEDLLEKESVNLSSVVYLPEATQKRTRILPIMFSGKDKGDKNKITGIDFQHSSSTIEDKGKIKGQQIQAMRDNAFLEHYLMEVAFAPFIHAGDLIGIAVKDTMSENGFSPVYSDIYLVEKAEHIWNREDQRNVYSKLVVGKSSMQAAASIGTGPFKFQVPTSVT